MSNFPGNDLSMSCITCNGQIALCLIGDRERITVADPEGVVPPSYYISYENEIIWSH